MERRGAIDLVAEGVLEVIGYRDGLIGEHPELALTTPKETHFLALHGFEASACDKVGFALAAALGQVRQRAGAFVA